MTIIHDTIVGPESRCIGAPHLELHLTLLLSKNQVLRNFANALHHHDQRTEIYPNPKRHFFRSPSTEFCGFRRPFSQYFSCENALGAIFFAGGSRVLDEAATEASRTTFTYTVTIIARKLGTQISWVLCPDVQEAVAWPRGGTVTSP